MEIAKSGIQGLGKAHVARQTYNRAIATEVRVHSARLDVTQAEIGDALGIDSSSMSRRMSGATPFRADELAAIAVLLGCTITDLLPSYDGNPVDEVRARNNKLPWYDSNVQPSAYPFPQVSSSQTRDFWTLAA